MLILRSTNDIVAFEIEAAETRFAANSESRSALALLFEGDHWMIFRNTVTGVLHWDFVSTSQSHLTLTQSGLVCSWAIYQLSCH